MRIGIVNDSLIARVALQRVVMSIPGHQVAWMARDGEEAVARALEARADLILMDLIMPGVDGVEATRRIMKQAPCPILVVTSSVNHNYGKVFEAMGLGALDAVDTPELGPSGDMAGARALLSKIETVTRLIGRPSGRNALASPQTTSARADRMPVWPLSVIGASTGGPAALAQILETFPDQRRSSLVIVQHVDITFATGLADWLSEKTRKKVELIEPGQPPRPGQILMAATNDHLILDEHLRFRYVVEPSDLYYRPSVDVFFQSVARRWPGPGAAALLTGMGRDGSEGLLMLRRAGWYTIAQDEATSVIWGMPGAAVKMGAAESVLPINEIGQAMAEHV